jgi:hypothetical protein
MKPHFINISDTRKVARSFGLKLSEEQLAADTLRANQQITALTSDRMGWMRETAERRGYYAESLRCGWHDPIETLCCWYQETAREMVAESKAAMAFYDAAYGPNN